MGNLNIAYNVTFKPTVLTDIFSNFPDVRIV